MLEVSRGRVEKLGLLFERKKIALYHYFYRLTRDKDLSQDLFQETFYRILRYRSGFRKDSRFDVWMYTIARNVCASYFRKNKRHHEARRLDNDRDMAAAETAAVVPGFNGHDVKVNKALDMLTAREKEILVLSRFQGLKYREIGEMMNLSENGVKIAVFRAIKNLRTNYFLLDKIE